MRDKLLTYLKDHADSGSMPEQAASHAWTLWLLIEHANSAVPVPNCSPSESYAFFSWDTYVYHFEAEVYADGHIEWFWWNRQTGALWEMDTHIDDPLPRDVLDKLRLFAELVAPV